MAESDTQALTGPPIFATTPLPRGDRTADVAIFEHRRERTSKKFRNGTWPDAEHVGYIIDQMPDNAVCVDGGAFLGGHTLAYLLSGKAWSVYAYEPCVGSRQRLNWSLDQNGVRANCDLLASGLSDVSGPAMMMPGSRGIRNMAACKLFERSDGDQRLTTLDNLKLEKLDVLKLDCERQTVQALRGSLETIARCRPAVVSLELEIEDFGRIVSVLTFFGYNDIRKFNRWDYVFTRKP